MGETEGLISLFYKYEVLTMVRLKRWCVRGASQHSAYMGNWPTIIDTFLALST